jgi:hypothetical protein
LRVLNVVKGVADHFPLRALGVDLHADFGVPATGTAGEVLAGDHALPVEGAEGDIQFVAVGRRGPGRLLRVVRTNRLIDQRFHHRFLHLPVLLLIRVFGEPADDVGTGGKPFGHVRGDAPF